MSKKFFSGDTIEQAVLSAARYFQIEPQEIAYEPVERRHGFLRVRRRAVISVDAESPKKKAGEREPGEVSGPRAQAPELPAKPLGPPKPTPTMKPEAPSASSPASASSWQSVTTAIRSEPPEVGSSSSFGVGGVAGFEQREKSQESEPRQQFEKDSGNFGDEVEAAHEALRRLLDLAHLELEVEVSQGDERLEVEIRGADEERLLEDRGRLLLAIQHLLPRMLRGLTGHSVPCWVDCENFHEIRTEQLRDLAQRTASQVRRDREMQTLEPMSPDERRIVHLTLSDDPAVETVSRGQGLFKRVQVRPVRVRPQGFDPYNR